MWCPTAQLRRLSVGFVAVALALSVVACSETSPTREIARDPSESTIPGVPPTAPPTTRYAGGGLSADAMTLIADLNDLLTEKDLCEVLTGRTLKPLLSGDFDLTNLVTSPSGVSQVLVAVDALFAHLVEIAPAEVKPAMSTVQDVWKRTASINPGATDRDAQVKAIMAEPETRAASEVLGNWLVKNCNTTANILSGIPGLGT